MIQQESALVSLLALVDRLPRPVQAVTGKRKPGRPQVYDDHLFIKALLIMIVRHWAKVQELYEALQQPTPEMQQLHEALSEQGRFPCRRTFNRRLKQIPDQLPEQIAVVGRWLLTQMDWWERSGRAVAVDSTLLRASGVVWHQKQRKKGEVPVTSIDTEAHWTKSGWHGWVYGWKLHVAATVGDLWLPIAAEVTPANVADSKQAPHLLAQLPVRTHFVLGDRHYNTPELAEQCWQQDRLLVTTHYGPYPHTDEGAGVRSIFHALRSRANENFNEHFKGIFQVHGAVPTKGLAATKRFALGAILLYQVGVWYRFEKGLNPCVGLKAFLQAV